MLKLNNVQIPSFVKVNKVKYSILPEITNNTLAVRGRRGVYLFGQEMTDRKITAEITIIADSEADVIKKTRLLASWLYHKKPVKLVNLDEPDKYYMAIPDGSTDIEETVRIGTGELTFLCTEVDAYGAAKTATFKPAADEIFQVNVGGTAETFPTVSITIPKDTTSFSLIHDEGEVLVGEPALVTKTNTNPRPLRINDHMVNVTNWTEGTTVDNGIVAGNMTSADGYGVMQEGKDYGTNASGWHGAAKARALPSPVQDFEIIEWLHMSHTKATQKGRIETYLRNSNGSHIGKVAFEDAYDTASVTRVYVRAGDVDNGKIFFDRTVPNNKKSYYILGRKKKKWYFKLYQENSSGDFKLTRQATYTDTAGKYNVHKLASVQIHFGAWKAEPAVNTMTISRVDVRELVELSNTQTPIIVEAGDVIKIDCSRARLYLNGKIFYDGLNPSSIFFSLKPGSNGLAVTIPGTTVTVTYTERWL